MSKLKLGGAKIARINAVAEAVAYVRDVARRAGCDIEVWDRNNTIKLTCDTGLFEVVVRKESGESTHTVRSPLTHQLYDCSDYSTWEMGFDAWILIRLIREARIIAKRCDQNDALKADAINEEVGEIRKAISASH